MEKEKIKKLPKKFGYRCNNLILNENSIELYDGEGNPFLAKTVGDILDKLYTFNKKGITFDLRSYIEAIPRGECGLLDHISAKSAMENFSGNQIVCMLELGEEIAYYKRLPESFIRAINEYLPYEMVRIINMEIYRYYLISLASDFKMLQSIVRKLINTN